MKPLSTFVVILITLALSMTAYAKENESEAKVSKQKLALVDKYFSYIPMRKMVDDMSKVYAQRLQSDKQKEFLQKFTKNLRMNIIEKAAKASLAKNLSVNELKALVNFVKQPAGRSALNNMKYYMADMMPVMQQELIRAIQLSTAAPQTTK